jgi:hypothetical protein
VLTNNAPVIKQLRVLLRFALIGIRKTQAERAAVISVQTPMLVGGKGDSGHRGVRLFVHFIQEIVL